MYDYERAGRCDPLESCGSTEDRNTTGSRIGHAHTCRPSLTVQDIGTILGCAASQTLIEAKKLHARRFPSAKVKCLDYPEPLPRQNGIRMSYVRYNQAASQMYRRRGVGINDLYHVLNLDLESYISEDGVHPSAAGKEVLAQQVARTIKEKLFG